ncbi:MAG: amidohydrolase [Bacteroidia bacterium]|nr:amidohydrolase [Bacteroidia bacterium]
MSVEKKPPIINCHVHIFTGDYVPPFLAKTYLPEPLYRLLSMQWVIIGLRWYFGKIKKQKYTGKAVRKQRRRYLTTMFFKRSFILGSLRFLVEAYLIICLLFYVGNWVIDTGQSYEGLIKNLMRKALIFLNDSNIILPIAKFWGQLLFIIGVLYCFPSIRNLFLSGLKLFKVLPGKETTDLFLRYVQIGRFSRYLDQWRIYDRLSKQYPTGTNFINLPMDMDFMNAGKVRKGFTIERQLDDLVNIKNNHPDTFHPFIFADPRRFATAGQNYFKWTAAKKVGSDHFCVRIDPDCSVYKYLVEENFAGIKIYPALGYYVFDEHLLPLWKYAADHDLPIMTHCIRGTIFYRGKKKKEWDQHPIFTVGWRNYQQQNDDDNDIEGDDKDYLYLNEVRNIDFSVNFSNPLNYLCLLDNKLLYEAIDLAKERKEELWQLFPSDHEKREVKKGHGLEKLKICLAHFGGEDQWKDFLESDRDNYTTQLLQNPDFGVDFFRNRQGEYKPGKLALIWRDTDWYTIICSMMLQYENVYADISYILHDRIILPLLKQTLSNPKLSQKVLYGSDFYVVRNHKSDKELLADMRAGLSEAEFDQIARYNPRAYLNLPDYND